MITEKKDLIIIDVFQRVPGLFHWKTTNPLLVITVKYRYQVSSLFRIFNMLVITNLNLGGGGGYFEIKTKYKLNIYKFISMTGYIYKRTYK